MTPALAPAHVLFRLCWWCVREGGPVTGTGRRGWDPRQGRLIWENGRGAAWRHGAGWVGWGGEGIPLLVEPAL